MTFKATQIHGLIAATLIGSSALVFSGNALANDSSELEALRALVQELDQKIRVLDRKSEIAEEKAVADKKAAPIVKADNKGFSISSADGAHSIKLRGLLQVDNRSYFGDHAPYDFKNDNVLRRVEPRISGTLYNIYDFDFNTELGTDKETSILDANINARFQPWLQIQVGKFKAPFSLERLQGGAANNFVEHSYVSDSIAPNREVGLNIQGKVLENRISYNFAVLNGTNDGSSSGGNTKNNGDSNASKEFAVRLFAEPFKGQDSVLAGLGFGIAATHADEDGDTVGGAFRTPGRQTFFSYNNAFRNGDKVRWSPQAHYYYGPFGLLAEFARSSTDVRNNANKYLATNSTTLDTDAWQIAGSWLITGENKGYGVVTPNNNFDLKKGGWGAWEIAARYHELEVDKDAFDSGYYTAGANSKTATEKAQSWTIGLNWYLNPNLKVATTFDHTSFDSGDATIKDRDDEKSLFTRFQVAF